MSSYQVTQAVVQDLLKDKDTIIDKFNSNRIVSISQDIKLELNNGTLTLKAGSKVYIPNGKDSENSNKFDAVTIENDVTYSTVYTSSRKCYALYDYSAKRLQMIALTDSRLSYDSTTNKVIHTALSDTVLSFPFALVVRDTTGIGSVDQIFNGFGYIGSTCYILPGITGYIPQGLNPDGTLINKIITQTKASCTTVTSSWGTGSELFFFNGIDSYIHRASKNCFYQATQPIVNDVENYWFNTGTGKFYETKNTGVSWSEFKAIPAFTITFDSGKITSLKSCGVHELVNSNATNLSDYGRQIISGLGKPSNKHIDLTVGASGTTYIAPANGYIYCSGHANASSAYISIEIPNSQYCGINGLEGHDLTTNQIALKIGDRFTLRYSNTTINAFRFVYDVGCS